jgi:hypothetical protein
VTRPVGATNVLTYKLGGFVNGQTTSVVSGSPALSTTATPASHPGTYQITATIGTLSAANYAFAFATGTLTVVKAPVRVVAKPTTFFTTVLAGKVTFSATVTHAGTGAAIPGAGVTFRAVTLFGYVITCNGVTNAAGFATCTESGLKLLRLVIPATYTATTPSTIDYLPGSGTATINTL